MKISYISNFQKLENINLLEEGSFELENQQILVKGTAILSVLLLCSLGTFSMVNATSEYSSTDLIVFSTFLGGTGDEHMDVVYAYGSTVVDSEGNIIVAGRTTSTDFPLKDAYQDYLNGFCDSTISKFSPNGSLICCC